jgi:hypothetical protein
VTRGRAPGPRPKGICPGCGELRALRDSGTLGAHNRLARGHYNIGACKGVNQPAVLFGPEPEEVIEVVVEPKVPEILAVRPSGTQTKIHLYIVGYQPGAKPRNPPDVALCNGTGSIRRNELVPIGDAPRLDEAARPVRALPLAAPGLGVVPPVPRPRDRRGRPG